MHIDKDADYGQGTQSAKRVSASSPVGTTGSRHQLSLQLSIVLHATTAALTGRLRGRRGTDVFVDGH